jgi:hypothetical protein
MVDLSLVLDVSSSIGSGWPAVRDAARAFANAFDSANDRFALITYGNGATVLDAMPSSRGFNKTKVKSDIATNLPGGSTAMVEGLYRGWDELRTVPRGTQSGLRVIVLFTDGASNSVPDGQTWDNPQIAGMYDTDNGSQQRSSGPTSVTVARWSDPTTLGGVPHLPLTSWHTHGRSTGMPTSFPLQSSTLTVNGASQTSRRGLRRWDTAAGRYPADVFNINNAARNLVEIIANEARADAAGDYPIRIFTIGMGELVRYNLGTMPEKPEDILKRIANDPSSPDFNDDQLEGKYYYARTAADVGPAFQALQNQILRLSK